MPRILSPGAQTLGQRLMLQFVLWESMHTFCGPLPPLSLGDGPKEVASPSHEVRFITSNLPSTTPVGITRGALSSATGLFCGLGLVFLASWRRYSCGKSDETSMRRQPWCMASQTGSTDKVCSMSGASATRLVLPSIHRRGPRALKRSYARRRDPSICGFMKWQG